MPGHEKVQCSPLNQKHSVSIFREQGGAAWRQQEDDVCRISPFFERDCFTVFQEKPSTLTEHPRERQGMKGMQ